MIRGGGNSQLGNNANIPHDPRTGVGQVISATSEARNVRYNGGGSTGISNPISNAGAAKWGQVQSHDNRPPNARGGGHGATKDKIR